MGFWDRLKGRKRRYEDENGYLRDADTDRLEHREVAEEKLGRPLRDGEVVHHIDRDKHNNHPSNLWVFRNQEEHHEAHEQDAEDYGEEYSYKGKSNDDDYEDDDDDFDDDDEDEDDDYN
jgi:hypothetical protein